MGHLRVTLGAAAMQGEGKLDVHPLALLGQTDELVAASWQLYAQEENRVVWKLCTNNQRSEMQAAPASCESNCSFINMQQIRKSARHLLSGIKGTTKKPSNPFRPVFLFTNSRHLLMELLVLKPNRGSSNLVPLRVCLRPRK